MSREAFCEQEKSRLEKMNNFLLENRYKKIGWTIFFISLAILFGRRFFDHPEWLRPLLRNLIILGLLIVSLSKEKLEDELIKSIRSKSYRLAFVYGVLYSFVLPYVGFFFDYLKDSKSAEIDNGFFPIILAMLLVQLMFFNVIKRTY